MNYCHSTVLSTLLVCTLLAPVAPAIAQQSTRTEVCPALLQYTVLRLQDEKPQSLCQYKELEALHVHYQDKGLVVLGFPPNDISQESGSNSEIAAFCENTFGVRFPMFTKSSVKGFQANAIEQQLALPAPGGQP